MFVCKFLFIRYFIRHFIRYFIRYFWVSIVAFFAIVGVILSVCAFFALTEFLPLNLMSERFPYIHY